MCRLHSRGSSETLVDQDISSLRDGAKVQDLVDRLRLQVDRLDISAEELDARNQRSFTARPLGDKKRGAIRRPPL